MGAGTSHTGPFLRTFETEKAHIDSGFGPLGATEKTKRTKREASSAVRLKSQEGIKIPATVAVVNRIKKWRNSGHILKVKLLRFTALGVE